MSSVFLKYRLGLLGSFILSLGLQTGCNETKLHAPGTHVERNDEIIDDLFETLEPIQEEELTSANPQSSSSDGSSSSDSSDSDSDSSSSSDTGSGSDSGSDSGTGSSGDDTGSGTSGDDSGSGSSGDSSGSDDSSSISSTGSGDSATTGTSSSGDDSGSGTTGDASGDSDSGTGTSGDTGDSDTGSGTSGDTGDSDTGTGTSGDSGMDSGSSTGSDSGSGIGSDGMGSDDEPELILEALVLTEPQRGTGAHVEFNYTVRGRFASCAVLYDENDQPVPGGENTPMCYSRTGLILWGQVPNMEIGKKYKLCGTGDYANHCSNLETLTQSYLQLHSMVKVGDHVQVTYSKNFPTSVHMQIDASNSALRTGPGVGAYFPIGDNVMIEVPVSHFVDTNVVGSEFYLAHGNLRYLHTPTVTVTE